MLKIIYYNSFKRLLSTLAPSIGLEIHVQLKANSKLFSDAPVTDGVACGSNQTVALFDLGTPGTLPTVNENSVKLALKASMLLNSSVSHECRFDRKHYFYPDMPMGYQITQNELPIAKSGHFDYYVRQSRNKMKRATIKQVQLEMDSGKLIHNQGYDLIDLNRAGIGLIEIVTEPCFEGPIDASAFVENLRWVLAVNDISDCQMHRGQLRVDANVSVAPPGSKGNVVEIKNINSFVDIEKTLKYEIRRQVDVINNGGTIETETRGIVDGKTVSSREKGEGHDYRFLPEPNIPRIKIEKEWLTQLREELRPASYVHYIEKLGFTVDYTFDLLYDDNLRRFVDAVLLNIHSEHSKFEPLLHEFPKILVECGGTFPPPEAMISTYTTLIKYLIEAKITRLTFIDLVKFYLTGDTTAVDKKIADDNLWRITDPELVGRLISDALQKTNPDSVRKAKAGKLKHFNRIRNRIIVDSQRRIGIDQIEMALKERLGEL
ncbi:unnamed protein product [Bursaphelenchus xylophilus]|uniref:Glutamyl-tRNA(Gln) amidotransferase subunit B, mitochondrial n=1 Tax=Bursaphelenchus xylophilus TaxID=6326 RepID=A0A1I7STD3_BURXY|nr:unnamed protein product [Bursaphelenchus xylophilus]CAG9108545.1 unnamed protein product [Bursaphelenchus xylophilus]